MTQFPFAITELLRHHINGGYQMNKILGTNAANK